MPVKYKHAPVVVRPIAGSLRGIEGGGAWRRSRHTNFNGVACRHHNTLDIERGLVGGEAAEFSGDQHCVASRVRLLTNKHGVNPALRLQPERAIILSESGRLCLDRVLILRAPAVLPPMWNFSVWSWFLWRRDRR